MTSGQAPNGDAPRVPGRQTMGTACKEGHPPVILGEPGDEALLGAVTLEILGPAFNPFSGTLQPMRMLLA